MVKLLNLILDTGNYPSSWRKSFIISIHKSGNKHDLIIYRGISLQNCITKLFSSALNSRLVSFYDNLFANHQFGFRTSHRTTDSLFSSPSSVRPLTFHILINSIEASGPIWTKLWWNGPWIAPFQNCVRWCRLPTKMDTKLKIEKRGDKILIVHCCFSIKWAQILTAATWQGVV